MPSARRPRCATASSALNDELEHDFGLRLRSRTGVNTGEVMVQVPDPTGAIAIGDAINVAARLQDAAEPGEVLLGDTTHLIVGKAVRVLPVEALTVKGRARPVRAFRLLEVLPSSVGIARSFEIPLVGRAAELDALRGAYDRSVRERRCVLVTVSGQAGIGKTRLCQELGRAIADDATVLTGRCLSYGEGITYWPVREMISQATGDGGVRALLGAASDADSVASVIESAVGIASGAAMEEEILWAARRLVESLASQRPLVLVFEDIHWAETTLLELVEHLAGALHDVPVLLVCVTRPELLDGRPGWGGTTDAVAVVLEPLSSGDASLLVDAVPAAVGLDAEARQRITRAAGGNPLFLEQMLAMVAHGGAGVAELAVPPAIQALLAARLERLEPADRRTLEHASIEGEAFHLGGVAALAEPAGRDAVSTRLTSLVRQDLIRAEPPTLPGEVAFRFRHALIREAAYDGLSKESRSDLHERHAAWLERVLGDRVADGEEFVGYHLERAYGYRAELGPTDGDALALADRARSRLGAAGLRAFRRGDVRASINLLERACALPSTDSRSPLELAPDLGFVLFQAGEFERAEAVLGEAIEAASALGDDDAEHRASLVRTQLRAFAGWEEVDLREATRQAEASLARLRDSGDDLTLSRAGNVLWFLHQFQGAPRLDLAERAFEHARRAGSRLDESWSLVADRVLAPRRPDAGRTWRRRVHQAAGRVAARSVRRGHRQRVPRAATRHAGSLRRSRGRSASRAARPSTSASRARGARSSTCGALARRCSPVDLDSAERTARAALEVSTEIADSWYYRAGVHRPRPRGVRARRPRGGAAAARRERGPAVAARLRDPLQAADRPCARARTARRGRAAEAAVREALRYTAETECLGFHADALRVLAEVLRSASRRAEAACRLEQAARLFERKGNVVSAARVRAELAQA